MAPGKDRPAMPTGTGRPRLAGVVAALVRGTTTAAATAAGAYGEDDRGERGDDAGQPGAAGAGRHGRPVFARCHVFSFSGAQSGSFEPEKFPQNKLCG